MSRYDSQLAQQRWEACKSLAAVEIPAFAVVEVVSAELAQLLDSVTDEPMLQVRQWTLGDVDRAVDYSFAVSEFYGTRGHRVRFNGPVPIPALGFGYVTRDCPTHALCHSIEGVPTVANNRLYCPVVGEWYLGEVIRFAGDTQPTDFVDVFQMAFPAPAVTDQADCVVGWIVRQSRTMKDLT